MVRRRLLEGCALLLLVAGCLPAPALAPAPPPPPPPPPAPAAAPAAVAAPPPCPPQCICLSQTQVLCNTGGLTELPTRLLPASVEQLALTKNHFPVIKSDAFAGLRALRKLSLDGNNVSLIKPFAFRGLPRLRELSIQHTPLASVAPFAFAGLQNITAILLAHNRIARVEGFAFAGTANVRLILLASNPMRKVETSAFTGLTNVEHLILPSGIREVEPDAFSGMETVGLLKLAFMDLAALQPHTFRGLSHVHVLAIQESDLGVVRAGAFDGLSQVGSLNLLNNKIDAVEELLITREKGVRVLRLHGNHLLESPRAGAVVVEGVDTLSVTNNHFPCDCHIHTLFEGPLANSSVAGQDFRSHNFCISPLELNGQPMSAVDAEAIGRCQEKVTRGNLEAKDMHGRNAATTHPRAHTLCAALAWGLLPLHLLALLTSGGRAR